MTETASPAPTAAMISLACVEICRFRRLARTRVGLDNATTILVGANNSGKTSILTAIRKFLSETRSFKAFDVSLSQWPKLRELGLAWEALAEDPASEPAAGYDWAGQLQALLSCMPTLDLWFDAQEGSYNYVAPFLTSLKWSGGSVGVRLRLEPASSVDDLQRLAWRYREARQTVRGLEKAGHAWPMDILDFWLRFAGDLRKVVAYKLDPAKSPLVDPEQPVPQTLAPNAQSVDIANLGQLIKVDFVPAQRGLGAEEDETRSDSTGSQGGLFSNQLLRFARQHLNVTATGQGQRADLVKAVAEAQQELDKQISEALGPSVADVKILGYPSLHDPQEIHFRTRIQTADLLAHSTAVQYRLDSASGIDFLPEYSIGLGYQNLQSLSYQLVSFKASRLTPAKGSPAAVHLVMVEEPEAHLHIQVQRIFPGKAHKLISPSAPEHSSLRSQLLISTHSSHLAHAEDFDRLRHVRRVRKADAEAMPTTEVINLGEAFGTDLETRAFAERYFRVQHTDLLFADAAIFVEGTAERMLVPLFVDRDFPELGQRYISLLDIGGSHAHRLQPLVERLGIPTLVITDVDPVKLTKDSKGRAYRKAVHIADRAGLECGNDTLTSWHPKIVEISGLETPTAEQLVWGGSAGLKVRFAWQLPIASASGQWPSSFEDSLILTNLSWFQELAKELDPAATEKKTKIRGALGKVVSIVGDNPAHADLNRELHDLLHGTFSKGDFAASIFESINAKEQIICPAYIADALVWLQAELDPTAKGVA